MKLLSLLSVSTLLFIPMLSLAKPIQLAHNVCEDYNNDYQPVHNRLYVCYNTRNVFRARDGYQRARYKGCRRSSVPCYQIDKNHFGKYNSNRAARSALYRCRTGTPRFVD